MSSRDPGASVRVQPLARALGLPADLDVTDIVVHARVGEATRVYVAARAGVRGKVLSSLLAAAVMGQEIEIFEVAEGGGVGAPAEGES